MNQNMAQLDGEWHRTPKNQSVLEELIRAVYDPQQIGISHHIGFVKDGEFVDLASAETFLFNHEVLKSLFGGQWKEWARLLVETPELERLSFLGEHKEIWRNKKS
jgi:hypothetical protein